MLPPLPRRSGWAYYFARSPNRVSLPRKGRRVGLRIVLFEACSAFTRVTACTLALSPIRDALSEGFSHFVASIAAPVASGWSGCRVGLAPTGKRRLVTAHTLNGHQNVASRTTRVTRGKLGLVGALVSLPGGPYFRTSAQPISDGGYIIVAPSFNGDGTCYKWNEPLLAPAATPEWLIAELLARSALLVATPSFRDESVSDQETKAALAVIDPDISREDWVRIGCALYSARGDGGARSVFVLCFSRITFGLIFLSRSYAAPGLVRLRQRFAQ
jgi:hypothetical protein